MNMQGNLGRNIPQAMPQGIASLSGMSPSPRAGIGNVQDRVDAFRQNPQALQTPPNVPPDLLDALALQKIMSEKEAAKREMAMAQPGQQPTIMQQLEQKALGDTKQEIAQQVGGVAQKQEQDKQQAMQRLMAGIARAPGAGQVMPTQMAGGGIVAFQNRGEVPTPQSQEESDRAAILSALEQAGMGAAKLAAAGYDVFTMPVRALAGIYNTLARGPRAFGIGVPFIPKEFGQESMTPMMDRIRQREVQKQVGDGSGGADLGSFEDLVTNAPQSSQAAPAVRPPMGGPGMRMPPAQVRSKVPAGVVGAVQQPVVRPDSTGQGISPPTQQAAPSYTQDLMKALGEYQTKEFKNVSELAKELYALPPEVRRIYEERIAQAKQPKDLVTRFAQLGGYGPEKSVATAYNKMMANERAGIRSAEDALIRAQEAARLESAKTALGARGKAAETFGNIAGVGERARATDVSADIARLDRESQERRLDRQIAAQRELKKMEMDNPEWKSKLEYALKNPQAAALMFPKGDKAALDYLKLQVDLKQSQMQALANDLSPDAAQRKKELAAEVATLSKALGELSGVPLSQPRPSAPAVGTVMQGYRFKGGDPSDRKNWEKV